MIPLPTRSTLFPYTTLFRSQERNLFLFELALRPAHYISRGWRRCNVKSRPDRSGEETVGRSEEHTSELQSLRHLVCRLLLEKKNTVIELVAAPPMCQRTTWR